MNSDHNLIGKIHPGMWLIVRAMREHLTIWLKKRHPSDRGTRFVADTLQTLTILRNPQAASQLRFKQGEHRTELQNRLLCKSSELFYQMGFTDTVSIQAGQRIALDFGESIAQQKRNLDKYSDAISIALGVGRIPPELRDTLSLIKRIAEHKRGYKIPRATAARLAHSLFVAFGTLFGIFPGATNRFTVETLSYAECAGLLNSACPACSAHSPEQVRKLLRKSRKRGRPMKFGLNARQKALLKTLREAARSTRAELFRSEQNRPGASI